MYLCFCGIHILSLYLCFCGIHILSLVNTYNNLREDKVPKYQKTHQSFPLTVTYFKGTTILFCCVRCSVRCVRFVRCVHFAVFVVFVGGTSTLNYCKVDLLPQDLYVLATDIIEKYQNGELSPSVESGQLLLVWEIKGDDVSSFLSFLFYFPYSCLYVLLHCFHAQCGQVPTF